MPDTHTITVARIPWTPAEGERPLPLGRNYRHDSRSLAYPFRPQRAAGGPPVLWARRIPILDQLATSSCTGNAADGMLGTDPLFGSLPAGHPVLDEAEALSLYSAAEVIDGSGPYPGADNGSSGTSVMQATLNAGLISGYTHATSLMQMSAALQQVAVIIGINWYSSFDAVDSSGVVTISPGAYVRGGHEVEVRGDDPDTAEFFADNSWGTGWGDNGSFRIPYAVMERLLAEQGDCTVPVPLSQPAPVPVPVPVPPQPPAPGPDPDIAFATDPRMTAWASRPHGLPVNRYAAARYSAWRTARGFRP